MQKIRKPKLRCGSCIFLTKRLKDKAFCSESGKNKGNPACKHWEPDFGKLTDLSKQFTSFLKRCTSKDALILKWLVDRQCILNNKGVSYYIGSTYYYKADKIYRIFIENITAKHIIGRAVDEDTSFTLSHTVKLYDSVEALERAAAENRAIKKELDNETKKIDDELYLKTGIIDSMRKEPCERPR